MFDLTDEQLKSAQDIIRNDPSLIWYTKSYDTLDIRSVAEAVFNFGYKQQFDKIISILGMNKAAQVFDYLDQMPRNNLHPLYRNYYSLYFNRHAPKHSN
jgi:hypothetical protein